MAIRKSSIYLGLSLFLLMATNCFGAWSGPQEIISGPWGSSNEAFGIDYQDMRDVLPEKIYLTNDGKVIIRDIVNGRRKVYSNYQLVKVIKCNKIDSVTWNEECNILGDYLTTKFDGNILSIYEDKYRLTTPTGELLATYDKKPLEFGIETSNETLDNGSYRQVIEYEDAKYIIVTPHGIESYARDQAGYLYGVESVPGTKAEWHSRVHKFDPCGKEMGYFDLPDNDIRTEAVGVGTAPATLVTVVEEYGTPVIGPDGSVYAWKRTPDTYSILKWTWVDDPNDPRPGPDAPANLKLTPSLDGLYLTWDASPQDPGCVDSYELERAISADGVYTSVSTTDPGVLKFNDTSALPGSSYYYKVRAKSGGLYSPYSPVVSGSR